MRSYTTLENACLAFSWLAIVAGAFGLFWHGIGFNRD